MLSVREASWRLVRAGESLQRMRKRAKAALRSWSQRSHRRDLDRLAVAWSVCGSRDRDPSAAPCSASDEQQAATALPCQRLGSLAARAH